MFARLHRFARQCNWISTLIALIAIAGQIAVAAAPLAEGRESRMASHVEASGARTHFVHDETKCVSCQARSMHGAPPRAVAPPIVPVLHASAIADRAANNHSAELGLQAQPRAPPTLI